MMSTILFAIFALLAHAVALKLALGAVGQRSANNKFSTALGVATLLNVAMFVTALVPVVGWIVKPLVWLLIIMAVYKIGFLKSVGVTVLQVVIYKVLTWLVELIGFESAVGA